MLRVTLDLAFTRNPDLALRFYEILFTRYPELQPLFGRNSREVQAKMLAEALIAVVNHLEDAPYLGELGVHVAQVVIERKRRGWLVQNLGALGARHRGYGVTDDMYPKVGDALISTLAEVAGDNWSAEIEAAWAEAYGVIVSMMLKE